MHLLIESWTPTHERWPDLVAVIAAEQQTQWAFHTHFEKFPRHFLVARQYQDNQSIDNQDIVGFLMFVVWEIGPHDHDHPPIQHQGKPLTEAKIIAFGVQKAHRRQGIGRRLQEEVLRRAKDLGCFQVRSVSESRYAENHQLKLSMGFAAVPLDREKDTLVFVMPLGHS
ncbi:MAG: GNAT family N-acetyltransferase [Deinococcota bacterium]